MTWTAVNPVTIGNATKKSDYDKVWDNVFYLRDYETLGLVRNLKPVVNAAVNKLDIFTKSGGAAPDATNIIGVAIPDGNGLAFRTKAAAVASGTGQIILADATDYWSKGSTSTTVGASTTRFDITNPAGTTARYTFDGTGTDPALSATWPRVGDIVVFNAQNFNAANKGAFVVTGSGANYIEVTNAAVVAENDKTIGTGSIVILRPAPVYLYAIWSAADSGIVFAAGGYSGFDKVPTTVTVGDDDYFLLEDSSTYTRVNTDRCVCIGKVWKTYHTTDTPDHRLHTALEFAPAVTWNPQSDYGYTKTLASGVSQESAIAAYSAVSAVVKQSGRYLVTASVGGWAETTTSIAHAYIKTGSATYAAAIARADNYFNNTAGKVGCITAVWTGCLEVGDTIHLGASTSGTDTNVIYGDDNYLGATALTFKRID